MKSCSSLLFALVLLMSLTIVNCGGDSHTSSTHPSQPPQVAIVSLTFSPDPVAIPAGKTQQISVTGSYSDNTSKDLTSAVTWNSSEASVASISSSGLLTALKKGSTTISATSGGVSKTVAVTVTDPLLMSLLLSPDVVTIPAGKVQQISVTGSYSDNTSQDLSSVVTWNSSDVGVASISSSGLLTALKKGSTTITATSGDVSTTTAATVTDPILTSVLVLPSTGSVAIGQAQQFVAYGIYSDSSAKDISALAAWRSDDTSIASVNAAGLASTLSRGSTKITATLSDVTGSADLAVTAAVLQEIDLTPDIASIPAGASEQLVATGTFSDGSTQDLSSVLWSSGDESIATVDSNGLVKGLVAGTVIITGQVGDYTDTAVITVLPATLVSIAVTPAAPSLATGTTQQFTATGTFTDGSTQDITNIATWSSDSPEVATINAAGLAKAVAEGTAVISASSGGKSAAATLVVTPAVVASIKIAPADSSMGVGGTQQFTATGVFSDSTTQDLTNQVTWLSSNANVGLVNSAGMANAIAQGTTTIGAAYGDVTGSTSWTVTPATLASISIQPDSPVLAVHSKQGFVATGKFTDGSTAVLAGISWSSSKPKIASINGSGLLRTKRQGSVTIKASLNGKTGSTTATISSSPVASIMITPVTATVSAGNTQQFKAMGYFADPALLPQDLTTAVYWTTDNYRVGTVSNAGNNAGIATGVSAGTVHITATYGSIVSDPASFTVQ